MMKKSSKKPPHPMPDLKLIAPTAEASFGKYSPNLYRWLKRHMKWTKEIYVFDSGSGLYIGSRIDGDSMVSGSRLGSALSPRALVGSYVRSWDWPIVANFWERYLRLGRCAIDPKHEVSFQQDNGLRYSESARKRTCNWCGKEQKKKTTTKIIRKKIVTWVDVGKPKTKAKGR